MKITKRQLKRIIKAAERDLLREQFTTPLSSFDRHMMQHDRASIKAALRNLRKAHEILDKMGLEEASDLVAAAIQELT
jgi:hypothetical protein